MLELDENVHADRDEAGKVVALRHDAAPYDLTAADLGAVTLDEVVQRYVNEVADLYGLAADSLQTLDERLPDSPVDEGLRLRRGVTKEVAQLRVYEFQATYRGLPIWNESLTVVGTEEPPRVVSSSSSVAREIKVSDVPIGELRTAMDAVPTSLREVLGVSYPAVSDFLFNGSRLLLYRYDPDARVDRLGVPVVTDAGAARAPDGVSAFGSVPTLPLPPVPQDIVPGTYYVVREVLFSLTVPEWGNLNWRAFLEPRTGAVLYLRALTAGQTCCVFVTDPVSATGQPLNGGSPAATLDAARSLGLSLLGLDPPEGNRQALSGEHVEIRDTDPPNVAPPTEASPFAFCYSSITDGFAAACAYFNHDLMFRTVAEFGFPVATYFDGATFPVPVDHRGWSIVNAQAPGNANGNGVGRFRYGLAASGQPVSIACDPRVCWHEFGHALLWDHVGSPNFGWCHSAGDSLGAILHDPESRAPDRFATFPFIPVISERRHDREVAEGWAWGGTRDDTQYGSEQILSTTLFRLYRLSGGDAQSVAERTRAARYIAYLIFHGIGQLTSTSSDPRTFVNAAMTADRTTPSFDGRAGGALHKVIRWSFEQQGLYQPAGAPRPVTRPGDPPAVDLYIDDGRQGGYEPYHFALDALPDLWNRRSPDGGRSNQSPEPGTTNAIYVRVRNRGTQTASGGRVRVYLGSSGSEMTWPTDFEALTPNERAVGDLAAGAETVVGPFDWIPAGGRQTILASVTATGDVSNAETVNGPLPSLELARLDNNVARRDFAAATAVASLPWLSLLLDDNQDAQVSATFLLTDD